MIDLNFALNIANALGAVIARQGGGLGDSIELDRNDLIQLFENYNPQRIEEALKYVSSKNIVVSVDNRDYDVKVIDHGDSYIIKLV